MNDAAVSHRFEDSLGYLVNHLMYAFRHGIVRKCGDAGFAITHEELGVLVLLRREDGATQTHLANTLAKDKAVITRLLNGLVRKDFVERRPDPVDRRIVRAFLTTGGSRAIQCIYPILMDYVATAIRGVTQDEFDKTCAVLRRIIANLKAINRGRG
ncbi:MAG: MarR family transcriptional regulator [Mariprofundaceae bacterium]|nr:MarR family transcriptional regulator [Mariprofundaceae bacterium]